MSLNGCFEIYGLVILVACVAMCAYNAFVYAFIDATCSNEGGIGYKDEDILGYGGCLVVSLSEKLEIGRL